MEANRCLKMVMIESNIEDCFKAMNQLINAVNKRSSDQTIPLGVLNASDTLKAIAEHFVDLMEKVIERVPSKWQLSLDPDIFRRAMAVDCNIQTVVFDGSREDMRTANEFLVRGKSYCDAIEHVSKNM